jgi:hypothetical protein
VGGYALAYHGFPRFTGDIDFWLEKSEENASKVIVALNEFGFGSLGISKEDFMSDQVVQLGYPPQRIDLLTSVSGIDFESAWKQKEQMIYQDITLNFIDLEFLRKNKLASGRNKDLDDLNHLPTD